MVLTQATVYCLNGGEDKSDPSILLLLECTQDLSGEDKNR
ncbi:hypothetical protein SDC9_195270 [bioreactor metagenome]|uniref:Uncharacterized protein n=1 Tax=bioreactor metagenome TaxID=1076179 RepID=A0A645I9U1_9ZZZZ